MKHELARMDSISAAMEALKPLPVEGLDMGFQSFSNHCPEFRFEETVSKSKSLKV